jgi:hypothetical protein
MRALCLATLCLSFACGDDATAVDAGADMHVGDLAMSPDLSRVDLRAPISDLAGDDFAGITCGSTTCSGGNACCIDPGNSAACGPTCGDGGIPAGCDGPEDCSGGTPICCGSLDVPASGAISGQTGCAATCTGGAVAMIGQGGSINSKVCHNAADCVGFTGTAGGMMRPFEICCHPTGQTIGYCAPDSAGSVPGLTCN